uniref:BUD13 homolog n=1 Tax=Gallus gallus TaxID=9031 RepID=A0A8V0ZZH8_CHICK
MAAQGVSKAQYLQRYLSGPPAAQPRRRRKKKLPSGSGRAGMRIVDDDVGWSSIAAVPEKEEEEDEGDMPVVAEFIDERPDEVKLMEEFRTNSKWKLLGDRDEDSQSSDVSVPAKATTRQQRHDSPDNSPPRRVRHDSPDLSPPRQERNNSPSLLPRKERQHGSPDLSPPRRKRHDSPDLSPPRRKRHDSPDLSPPRRKRHDSPDLSPPRRKRHDSPDLSPPRRKRHDSPDLSPPRRKRHDSPDLSPPRRKRHDSPDLSPPRRQRHDSPDLSPPRRKRHDSPDLSPPRRQRHDSPDPSPPRKKRHDSPDLSPVRISSAMGKKGCKMTDKSLLGEIQGEQLNCRHSSSDKSLSQQEQQTTPDLSLQRKKRYDSDPDSSPSLRKRARSPGHKKPSRTKDASPVKKLRRDSDSPPPRRGTQNASEADLSPQGKNHRALPSGKGQHGSKSPPDLSRHHYPDDKGSPKKGNMMSGVRAGLVSADVLRREQQELRKQERSSKHLEEESRHTETIFRDKSGRKRDLVQERLEQQQKDEAKSERDEQYARWGRGLAQGRQQQQNVEDAIKEMQKPLARYIDDEDLDRMLREQEREGDPMAEFIKKRKAKESKEKKEKPRYSGPAPPLNRFNIWPGHRWDGVDSHLLARKKYKAPGPLCFTSPFPAGPSICSARYLNEGPTLPLCSQGYLHAVLCSSLVVLTPSSLPALPAPGRLPRPAEPLPHIPAFRAALCSHAHICQVGFSAANPARRRGVWANGKWQADPLVQ